MSDPIEQLIEGRPRDLGGFTVRRVLPHARRRMVGPFIFLDEMGPARFTPGQGIDVRPHPHIGLATVTYLFAGRIMHRDSLGYEQAIEPGAVNLMTAGRGITHSERTPAEDRGRGHDLHGIQTWLALPRGREEDEPAFAHHPAHDLPRVPFDGGHARVLAGSAFGVASPAQVSWPTLYAEVELSAGGALELPAEVEERAVYPVAGALDLAHNRLRPGSLAVLRPGPVTLRAAANSRFMLIGGAPMDGPREIFWNFVASDRARIEQAQADWTASAEAGWRNSRFVLPPGEHEHIPLPATQRSGPPVSTPDCPTT
ncbi:MAG TPA: pirin family protein [Alphaproteobacteria bacterium]|nr:pirin family protein [Alphaproteobacteria bacterium]